MKPAIWGPHAWIFLHDITFDYPIKPTDTDKSDMKNFIYALANVLPCRSCRANFKLHLTELPLTDEVLSTRANLVKWMIDIHNRVNKSKGYEEKTYPAALECICNIQISNSSASTDDTSERNDILCILDTAPQMTPTCPSCSRCVA